jgi:hypothetical protein
MKNLIIFLICTLFCSFSANKTFAQKWLPGHYTELHGNVSSGLIRLNPPGKEPVKDENFIEFKPSEKDKAVKISASQIKSIVIGRDSLVVAAEPQTSNWEFAVDFVKVALDEDIKLYVFNGEGGNGGGGIQPDIEAGVGAGVGGGGSGFGGGIGAGITIPIGHGRGGNRTAYYYGLNTANMHRLTNANFVDIMSDIMGDEPDVVEQIQEKKFNLENINKLIAYFKQVQASHTNSSTN